MMVSFSLGGRMGSKGSIEARAAGDVISTMDGRMTVLEAQSGAAASAAAVGGGDDVIVDYVAFPCFRCYCRRRRRTSFSAPSLLSSPSNFSIRFITNGRIWKVDDFGGQSEQARLEEGEERDR
jgi:hypothetical protein